MKGRISIPFLSIVFIILISWVASFSGSCMSECEITNYTADIIVDEKGNMHISEEYTYNYFEDYHAKYRDINFNKYNPSNPIAQRRDDIAQVLAYDGTPITSDNIDECIEVYKDGQKLTAYHISDYKSSNDESGVYLSNTVDEYGEPLVDSSIDDYQNTTSLFAYVPSGLTNMRFVYKYTISGATTFYNDIASINWRLFTYNEADVLEGKVTITLPTSSSAELPRIWARGASKGEISEVTSNAPIVLDFSDVDMDSFLEFRLLSDLKLYKDYSSIHQVSSNALEDILAFEAKQAAEDNNRILLASILFYGSFVLLALMVVIFVYVYKKYDKEYQADFTGQYYRELPSDITPAEMSYLYYFGKINDEDVTATLLDLVRKKYLILENNSGSVNEDDPDFTIILEKDTDLSELKAHEKHLIDWFINQIGDGEKVTIEQIEKYGKTYNNAQKFHTMSTRFVSFAKNVGKSHNYIETTKNQSKAFAFSLLPIIYFVGSLILMELYNLDVTVALIVSGISCLGYLLYVSTIKRRTKAGNEEYAKWKAFKNFLEDFSHMEDYPMPGIIIWEHYLVYATSLKIADKVMEQLKVKLPNIPDDEISNSTYMYRGYYYHRHYGFAFGRISNSISVARSTSMQTIAAHAASSVSSGGRGGGFSGGSSFGGGGGGGRSR